MDRFRILHARFLGEIPFDRIEGVWSSILKISGSSDKFTNPGG